MTMTFQEHKRINRIRIMLVVIFFIYASIILVKLYLSKTSEYGSVTNNNYINRNEDVQINSYKLYPGEPTKKELQIREIEGRSAAFLDLNSEPELIP